MYNPQRYTTKISSHRIAHNFVNSKFRESIIRKSRFIFTKEWRTIRQKSGCLNHSNERIFHVIILMQGRIKDSSIKDAIYQFILGFVDFISFIFNILFHRIFDSGKGGADTLNSSGFTTVMRSKSPNTCIKDWAMLAITGNTTERILI